MTSTDTGPDTGPTLTGRVVLLDSTRPDHGVCLNCDEWPGSGWGRLIPRGHDITGFTLDHVPEGLEAVQVVIGGGVMITYDGADMEAPIRANIWVSKCSYHTVVFRFVYSKAYLEGAEETVMVDETETVAILGPDVEYWDSDEEEVRTAQEVTGYEERKTGRRVLDVLRGVEVDVPTVTFETRPGAVDADPDDDVVEEDLWEYVTVDPARWSEDIVKKCADRHGMRAVDGTALDVAMAAGAPFKAKIRNTVVYKGDMAGKKWAW